MKDPIYLFQVDSLTGMGAVSTNRVYSTPVFEKPGFTLNIVLREKPNTDLALRRRTYYTFWRHLQV